MIGRRQLLRDGTLLAVGAGLASCGRLSDWQPNCPIPWAVNVLQPVFHGYRDYNTPSVRIFFPTLEGTPQQASILAQCEHFPLVMIIHGDCPGLDPKTSWLRIASQLARTGYVVAVADIAADGQNLADGTVAQISPYLEILTWLRSPGGWEYADRVMPGPATALVGHSRGATLCADVAATIPVSAFVSLSGVVGELFNPTVILKSINCPSLYLWGDDLGGDNSALFPQATNPTGPMWGAVNYPKHAIIFRGGHHGDYFPTSAGTYCAQNLGRSACPLVPLLAADYITAFVSRYLTPELAFTTPSYIPESLFLKPQNLQQSFYSGDYLSGFAVSSVVIEPDRGSVCVQRSIWDYGAGPGAVWISQAIS